MKLATSLKTVFAVLVLALSIHVSANTMVVSKQTQGYGGTRELAINKAIKNAIIQVNGASFKTETRTDASKGGYKIDDGNTSKSVKFEFENSSNTELKANGLIKSYDVVSVVREGDMWKAELIVDVIKYELDRTSSRKKVALLPVENRVSKSAYGKKLAMQVQDAIENHLVQSRRFAVLSRSDIDKVIAEQNFINSAGVLASEKVKLGNLLGGDVLLSVTIVKSYYSVKEKFIEITGQTEKKISGALSINLKVISAVTGEIKFSEKYSSYTNSAGKGMTSMVAEVSAKSVKDLVKRIYPPLVVKVDGAGNIFLNVGGSGVKKGERFDIYEKGEAMIDLYTGESLGSSETKVGSVKVTRVESKFSVAKVSSGGGFAAGMIARSKGVAYKSHKPKLSPQAEKPAGGFKLPFD